MLLINQRGDRVVSQLDFNIQEILNPTTYAQVLAFFEQRTGKSIAEQDWRTFIKEYEMRTGKKVHPSMPPSDKKELSNFIWQKISTMAKENKWALIIMGAMIVVFIGLWKAKEEK